ncbi:MAG: hypothetical protein JWR15_3 [Prosthecobacter sp.]|nr:hypothetical protein [Prosthecobacter sp.]
MHTLANASFQWWLSRLPKYNLGLIIAGVSAFIAYVLIGAVLLPATEEFEVTFFTFLLQGFGYLIMMAFANVCYLIGPASEIMLRPDDVSKYREKWYKLGCQFSFALPFCVPVMLMIVALLRL